MPNAPNYRTLNDIFLAVAASGAPDTVRIQAKDSTWTTLTALEFYGRVRALAASFAALGLRKGDRVALVAENRWEWAAVDFATLAAGLVNVPLFPTLQAAEISRLLAHSGAQAAVVSTAAQLRKIDPASVEHRIVMDEVLMDNIGAPGVLKFTDLTAAARPERDPAFDEAAQAIAPGDLASIIYTSGTTGEPKGVMLTHGNLASNVCYSLREFHFEGPQRTVSFLPLSHVTARHVDYCLYALGFSVAYVPAVDRLMPALKTIRPTLLVAVPRVLEKVRGEIERRARASKLKTAIVEWALSTGKRHEGSILAGRRPASPLYKLADTLFYSKVRAVFGGEVKYLIAGGAPLGPDTAHWFARAGIRLYEGYGLTETSPVIGVNTDAAYRFGTIGKPLANLQVKLAEDGELLVKGPSVFGGYWAAPELTAEAFTPDGWFLTGDIATLDADGFLAITDRKKELLKTSAGKFIAPQLIEGKLKADSFIAQAAVFGDREKHAAALLAPNFELLEPWARERKLAFAGRAELIRHPDVLARYRETVKRVNRSLAPHELVKQWALVADEWAIDSGELTPSMKLKRRVLAERYRAEIAALFR